MNKNIFNLLAIFALTIIIISCAGRTQNRKLVEADRIHQAMMLKHDSIYKALEIQEERVKKKLESLSPNNPDRAAFLSMERSIKRSYGLLEKWDAGVTNIPGFESAHIDKADPNTTGNANPNDMSDQEILDLQKAYSEKLDQIGQKIGELVTTMDMYTKQ